MRGCSPDIPDRSSLRFAGSPVRRSIRRRARAQARARDGRCRRAVAPFADRFALQGVPPRVVAAQGRGLASRPARSRIAAATPQVAVDRSAEPVAARGSGTTDSGSTGTGTVPAAAKYSRSVASRIIVVSQASSSACRARARSAGAVSCGRTRTRLSVQRPAQVVVHPCPSLSVPPIDSPAPTPARARGKSQRKSEFALRSGQPSSRGSTSVGPGDPGPGHYVVTRVPRREAEAPRAHRLRPSAARSSTSWSWPKKRRPMTSALGRALTGPFSPIASDSGLMRTSTSPVHALFGHDRPSSDSTRAVAPRRG